MVLGSCTLGAPVCGCLSGLRALSTLGEGQCLPRNNAGLKFNKPLCNSL